MALILYEALIAIMVGIIMSVWTTNPSGTPLSAAYAAFFMQRIALGTAPLIWSWLSDLLVMMQKPLFFLVFNRLANHSMQGRLPIPRAAP